MKNEHICEPGSMLHRQTENKAIQEKREERKGEEREREGGQLNSKQQDMHI